MTMNVALLTGAESVLIAQVPSAGNRWQQVHLNMDVGRRFFRVEEGDAKTVSLERLDGKGASLGREDRPLVLGVQRNYRIEFDFSPAVAYPTNGRPLLVILELGVRRLRYITLMPGAPGHEELLRATNELPKVGGGLSRVITTLDEVELRWAGCPFR